MVTSIAWTGKLQTVFMLSGVTTPASHTDLLTPSRGRLISSFTDAVSLPIMLPVIAEQPAEPVKKRIVEGDSFVPVVKNSESLNCKQVVTRLLQAHSSDVRWAVRRPYRSQLEGRVHTDFRVVCSRPRCRSWRGCWVWLGWRQKIASKSGWPRPVSIPKGSRVEADC